jgi:hypothetical protein
MAQRKDSPDTPTKGGSKQAAQTGGGNAKSAGGGGGKGRSDASGANPARSTSVHREKAAPGDRRRGETNHADRA